MQERKKERKLDESLLDSLSDHDFKEQLRGIQRSLVPEAPIAQELSKTVLETDLSANHVDSPPASFELPTAQEFSKGVEEEGFTSTQALVSDSLCIESGSVLKASAKPLGLSDGEEVNGVTLATLSTLF